MVASDAPLAERPVHELRGLDWIAVSVDSCEIALEMMEVVEFFLVIVDVAGAADWRVCRRLVESRRSAVAIITTSSRKSALIAASRSRWGSRLTQASRMREAGFVR